MKYKMYNLLYMFWDVLSFSKHIYKCVVEIYYRCSINFVNNLKNVSFEIWILC